MRLKIELRCSGEKSFAQGGGQEPDGHSDSAPEFQKDNPSPEEGSPISAALHQLDFYGQMEATPQYKANDSLLGVCQKALKDSQTMRNKIIWSDETKIELFDLNAKRHVWRKPGTNSTVKHGGVGMFFSGRHWETSQDQGKDERSKVQGDP